MPWASGMVLPGPLRLLHWGMGVVYTGEEFGKVKALNEHFPEGELKQGHLQNILSWGWTPWWVRTGEAEEWPLRAFPRPMENLPPPQLTCRLQPAWGFFLLLLLLTSIYLWLHQVPAAACRIFWCSMGSCSCGMWLVGNQLPNQGWSPRPAHWKADSQPLDHQGSPPAWPLIRLIQEDGAKPS